MTSTSTSTEPKRISAFVSYSQTPVLADGKKASIDDVAEHKRWVLELANRLRSEANINAILDQTHLRPGNDAYKFMEQTVTGEIDKVVIIVDLAYTNKANAGVGGVGTESQIISPEIYNHAEQTKFIAVLRQRDEFGKASLPPWLKTTIWIEMSSDELAEENFETLVRALYDKPLHVPAPYGNTPSYLESSEPQSPSSTKIRSAQSALQGAKPNAAGFVHDALDAIHDDLMGRGIDPQIVGLELDKALLAALEDWKPRRDEYLSLIKTSLRYGKGHQLVGLLPQFFESFVLDTAIEFQGQNARESHFVFAVYEMWLQTVALMLEAQAFEPLINLMTARYRCQDRGKSRMASFTVFRPWDNHHIQYCKAQIDNLKAEAALGTLLNERCSETSASFEGICEADLLLFFCDVLLKGSLGYGSDGDRAWVPYTRFFITGYYERGIQLESAFDFLRRSKSRTYFEDFRPLIGSISAEELKKSWLKIVGEGNNDFGESGRGSLLKEFTKLVPQVGSQP